MFLWLCAVPIIIFIGIATERQQRVGSALSNAISAVREARNNSIAVEQRHNFRKRRSTFPSAPPNYAKRATSWKHKFFCLSETDDDTLPLKKNNLILAGLGEKLITIPNIDCCPSEFHELIFKEFPKLREGGGIEFLKCIQSTRKLEPIPFEVSSSPRLLKSWIGAARVYIRPIQVSLDLTPEEGHTMVSIYCAYTYNYSYVLYTPSMQATNIKEKCLQCGRMIAISHLRDHIKIWYYL